MADSGYTVVARPHIPIEHQPRRAATRSDFEIAVICALTLEADAVDALFERCWDNNGPPYDKAPGDPNAYSTGIIGRHNVVLAHMPSMGKASAAAVAANCRTSFPNIKLAIIVGVCSAIPFDSNGSEILLGDVIFSDGVVQYDLGRRFPERFKRKDTLLDSLGRPNAEIRSLLAKLKGRRGRKMLRDGIASYMDVLQAEPDLAAQYPGVTNDRLFEAAYRHIADGKPCDECGCAGPLVSRRRLEQGSPMPAIHFGLIASGDTVMKSGEDRDAITREENIIGFEMEGAGVWDSFPCVVIKGACDYADSHKTKAWQRYAAATAAACMKAFLDHWVPSASSQPELRPVQAAGPWFLVPYPRNGTFVGRTAILEKLQQQPLKSTSQSRISLFGLGGIGKTQIVLEHTHWLQETHPEVSVFWVHASNAERFRQSFTSIALECHIPGYDDPKTDMLSLVQKWLERKDRGWWVMVLDNADDAQLFFPSPLEPGQANNISREEHLAQYIPECAHGSILVTTRNKQAGLKLAKSPPIEIDTMNDNESEQLLRANLGGQGAASSELLALSSRLEHLPLALVQAAAFIVENSITAHEYLHLLDKSDQDLVDLLSEEFETVGRDSKTPRAVAEIWILSFDQIQQQNAFAGELLSLMSFFDRQAIPIEFLAYYGEQQPQGKCGEMQLLKALGILKAFSFVTMGKDQSLDIHRLVQLVSRKWLARNKRMTHFTDQALLAVSHSYPFGNYENWVKCRRYLPHAYAVVEFEGSRSKDERTARVSLLHNVAAFCFTQGQWEDAESLQAEAVDLTRNVLGADHPDTLASMGNLASTYRKQGWWEEAEKLEVQVMETFKTKLGADHPITLNSMSNLALTFWNKGRWDKAKKLFVQVLETRKTKLGADHPDTLASMGNLASTYRNQGWWDKAKKLEVQVMETFKTKLGADHPDTLASMSNLASTYRNQGWWDEAERLEVQVMVTRKTKLGADHPDTLASMGNLASTYRKQGWWDKAEKLEVQVMETFKTKIRVDHPDTLTSMSNLASTFWNQGRWDEAEKLFAQVMVTRKTKLGDDHPETLAAMGNLALTYQKQGRWDEAERLEVQVMETFKTKLGADHFNTLTSMANLAFTWKNMSRHRDALRLMHSCSTLRQRVLGLDHPQTVSTLRALVEWQKESENLAKEG